MKFFSIDGETASQVMWRNPLFFTDLSGMAVMAGFLGNMVVTNGPAASPLHPDTKRLMSSVDLVNLGFFTEALLTAFSLLDDLTQRVVQAGIASKGLDGAAQKTLLRTIKEDRLNNYLNHLTKLCDWVSLEDRNAELNKAMLRVNRLRNDIMHGDRELSREESLRAIDVIATVILYLTENPFGVDVAGFPELRPANPQLTRMPDVPGSQSSGAETPQGS